MSHTPLSGTRAFTCDESPYTESLAPILTPLLHGNVNDPAWREQMRDLLIRCSPGPFDVSSGDPRVDPDPIAVVTNPGREVLAKCGPVADARSCFDAILFAAAVNAVRKLLETRDSISA